MSSRIRIRVNMLLLEEVQLELIALLWNIKEVQTSQNTSQGSVALSGKQMFF